MSTDIDKVIEEFNQTIAKRNWGACFECCDYEKMVDDIGKLLASALTSLRAETRRQFAEEVVEALENNIIDITQSVDEESERNFNDGIEKSQEIVRSLSTSNQ